MSRRKCDALEAMLDNMRKSTQEANQSGDFTLNNLTKVMVSYYKLLCLLPT